MKNAIRALVAFLVIGGGAGSVFAQQNLDDLIQTAQVASVKRDNGSYRVPWTLKQTTVDLYLYQEPLGTTHIKTVGIFAELVTLPTNYKLPQPLLDKIFELNCEYPFGRVVREGDTLKYRSYFLL